MSQEMNFTRKRKSGESRCNICRRPYRPKSRYERFCRNCRNHEQELLRFADWLNAGEVSC